MPAKSKSQQSTRPRGDATFFTRKAHPDLSNNHSKVVTIFKNKAQLISHSFGIVVAFINPATMKKIAALHSRVIAAGYNKKDDDENTSELLSYLKEIYNVFRLMGREPFIKVVTAQEAEDVYQHQFNICNSKSDFATVSDKNLYESLFENKEPNTCVFISYGNPKTNPSAASSSASLTANPHRQYISGLCVINDSNATEFISPSGMKDAGDSEVQTIHGKQIVDMDGEESYEYEQFNDDYMNDKIAELAIICTTPNTTEHSTTVPMSGQPLLLQSLAKIAAMKSKKTYRYNGVIVEASRKADLSIPAERLLTRCGFRKIRVKFFKLDSEPKDNYAIDDFDTNKGFFKKTAVISDREFVEQDYFVIFDKDDKKWFEQIDMDVNGLSLCPPLKHGNLNKYPYCM